MALERLTQITEVGIKSGITLRNINVEGAYVSGVVTATTLTVTNGFNVNGVVTATSFNGNVVGSINPTSLNVSGVSTFNANVFLGDGDIAYFGDGQDLLIFHNSTDSIIRDNGTGDLYIEGGNRIRFTNPTALETYAVFNQDGASELYYDNVKKLETTSGGVTVSGGVSVSGVSTFNNVVVGGATTALVVNGNARITGILTIGTSSVTINGTNDSITVGSAFIKNNSVGLGQTNTAGRNAGVGTATGTLIFNSTTNTIQVWTGGRWADAGESYIEATGGTISDYSSGTDIYRSHIFTSSGTLSITKAPATQNTVDYLVVAGGGGGGSNTPGGWAAGGGGAGGLRTGAGIPVSSASYTVTVGGGGNGGGNAGSPSIFSTITSNGGGGGGNSTGNGTGNPGNPGGSGGGGAGNVPSNTSGGTGNTPPTTPPQGNPGGASSGNTNNPGTGGGAGSAGYAGNPGGAATPGAGTGSSYTITGIAITYAQGGGAQQFPGSDGIYSTGFGGDGRSGIGVIGGSGGSGIVVVRYPIGNLAATAKATGGLISYAGGKTIHQFLSSGTFTVTNPVLSSVDYLVVAAGGGGGGGNNPVRAGGGGGGAGGMRTGTGLPVTSGPYSITVGAGGALVPNGATGNPGNQSIFSSITSSGGGGGGGGFFANGTPENGLPGGSGGGGAESPAGARPGGTGNTPPTSPPQGNNGGNGGTYPSFAGGGGGAGGAGQGSSPGNGGNGLPSSISGSAVTYAGGGGGRSYFETVNGTGGTGGGGPGGTNGTANLGGGGGGQPGTGASGSGGSGIVIISYPS